MKKSYFIILLGITFLLSDESRWSSTRFEHWWNKEFNSMMFKESFSFMPYKFKIGTFQYGGDDFWEQIFSEDSSELNTSPFITDGNVEFDFIDDIKFREGIDLEIDFLGYNFFKKFQNSIDIITSLSYKLNKPFKKALAPNWPNLDNENIFYYYPVLHSYNINAMFSFQFSEYFSPYFNYSYGWIDGKLFRDSNNDDLVSATGIIEGFDLGFNIISELKNKTYSLTYGFELGLDKVRIDEVSNVLLNPITAINNNNIALRFTIGIIYGGNKTKGDEAFRYLIDSDYVDAIANFNQFKISNNNHPKIKLANKMIKFSYTQIAYDMLYNGINCYREGKIDSALIWYTSALDNAQDSTLIYEIKSRQYIIADKLFNSLDDSYNKLSTINKIDYLDYLESISYNINPSTEPLKVNLLYKQADSYLLDNNYYKSYHSYQNNYQLYPDYEYIYIGKINSLISLIIQDINDATDNKEYFRAYEYTRFLNTIYPNINSYIEDNLMLLKEQLDIQNSKKRDQLIVDIINDYKKKFNPIDDNTLIQLGDSYAKSMRLLGNPIDVKHRMVNNQSYFMALYSFNNRNYRLFFEDEVLFDIIKE